jgi:threonine/homoserine/homoserine lactone efflux protein
MNELILIFTFSLVVALSGAIVPGPLLTYTIVKTLDTRHRGFLVGVWVIGGHALLESVLIVGILLGFSTFLKNSFVIKIIGILGGSFLLYMGLSIIVDIIKKRVKFALGEKEQSARRVDLHEQSLLVDLVGHGRFWIYAPISNFICELAGSSFLFDWS